MNLTEIIEEMMSYGMPREIADRFVAQLISAGAQAAVYRPETIDAVADRLRGQPSRTRTSGLFIVAKDEGHHNAD